MARVEMGMSTRKFLRKKFQSRSESIAGDLTIMNRSLLVSASLSFASTVWLLISIESVGLFLASFAGMRGIPGIQGTVDEKGKSLEKQKIAVS